MRSDASRGWTPQAVHDELRRIGRTTARTSIQTFLQRSVGKEVRRKGSGVYQLEQPTAEVGSGNEVTASVSGPRSSDAPAAADSWLTEEVLQRVAAEAQNRFLATHPGEADPDELVQEAKRRVAVWIARHHQEPYDEAHLRRLMKTAIDDRYRRSSRNGSMADHDEERDEVSP